MMNQWNDALALVMAWLAVVGVALVLAVWDYWVEQKKKRK